MIHFQTVWVNDVTSSSSNPRLWPGLSVAMTAFLKGPSCPEMHIVRLTVGNVLQDYVSECPEENGFFADALQCDRYYECDEGVVGYI